MLLARKDMESRERRLLAPYGFKSSDSRGRRHAEKEHENRTCFQRDRDRVLYSTAFRRLEYKTQVFVNHEGDYYRTRLTHTLEVAQVARSIARSLRLNEDLTEAVALAHDLGHTPFGHSGEAALQELMKGHGGFDHNIQGLRVVDYLERRYPDFPGLNLSWEVREGIAKHSTLFDHPSVAQSFDPSKLPLLETQVVDIADEIAYDNHDLDDGLTSGLVHETALRKVPLWRRASARVRKGYSNLGGEMRKCQIIRALIDMQITDLLAETETSIRRLGVRRPDDVRKKKGRLVGFSRQMAAERAPLKEFLSANLYCHYRVVRMADKAKRFIIQLFGTYLSRPEQLPGECQARIRTDGVHRVICDYLASMTDRYALDEYKKFFEPYERV